MNPSNQTIQIPGPGFVLLRAIPDRPPLQLLDGVPGLWLKWEMRVTAGTEQLCFYAGGEKVDLPVSLDQLSGFLDRCDERLETDIAKPVYSALHSRFLQNSAEPDKRGESATAEITVRITYNIRVWMTAAPGHEVKGVWLNTIRLDPRQIRGYVELIKYSINREIIDVTKNHVRRLAMHWIEGLSESHSEPEQKLLAQDLCKFPRKRPVAADELPPTMRDIKVLERSMV
jgi:hypothetical protein